jgi:hypothetical protein
VQIKEVEEGDELEGAYLTQIFSAYQASNARQMYHSLLPIVSSSSAEAIGVSCRRSLEQSTPRLYLMTSLYGQFEAKEVLNPLRSDKPCPYPFFHFQLYEEKQPALFMVDCESELYIWQGKSRFVYACVILNFLSYFSLVFV